MTNDKIVEACRAVLSGLQKQEELDRGGKDKTWKKRDVITANLAPIVASIVAASASTLAACGAKASLYTMLARDDLAASLATDVTALAATSR